MSAFLLIERLRLRLHFARVLARYARAGAFPRHGGRGTPRPVFVDAGGNRCAMAHLLERSGHAAAVHRIAASRNHAYVAELARCPDIAAAIRGLGISEDEAARIQPCYSPSAAACLFAFLLQWAGALSAVWLGVAAVRRVRSWRAGAPRSGGRRIAAALAVLLVLAGVISYDATTHRRTGHDGGLVFCSAAEDYAVCGSAFSVPSVIRSIRALGTD
jgi:hypothetical protein